jgi:hypothetical protein
VGIKRLISKLSTRLGDPSLAEMNTTRMEESSFSLEELTTATRTVPFLTSHRLVVVTNLTQSLRAESQRERFLSVLEDLPDSTKLAIVEPNGLRDRKYARIPQLNQEHWLLKWIREAGERAYVGDFELPREGKMTSWIRNQAAREGGRREDDFLDTQPGCQGGRRDYSDGGSPVSRYAWIRHRYGRPRN